MDVKIWENTIITWLNSLSNSSPIKNINQIKESHLKAVIKKINSDFENTSLEFLKKEFPNLTESNSLKLNLGADYLCASTLLLIYVSLSKSEDVNEIRDLMCLKLDTAVQLNIVEFLSNIQEYEGVFKFSFKKFTKEIFPQIFINFKGKYFAQNSVLGNVNKTPIKNDSPNVSFDSPLQGFFQTPKRSGSIHSKNSFHMCGDGDHAKRIKKLTDQLVEEESEKASLQEQLISQTQKCNDFEMKLKSKIEEINNLKEDWSKEIMKNEDEVMSLKNILLKKVEKEKIFKGEISHLENYISKLESDLSNYMSKNDKLEIQLKTTIERFSATEEQLKDTTELCAKLQSTINEKEKELLHFKENYENFYNDEKSVDVSFINKSTDKSMSAPENLGVVIDKLLKEKIEENEELQEAIQKLRDEKNCIVNELKSLREELELKSSIASELQVFKNELNTKTKQLEKTEEDLFKMQKEILDANAEITKLNKENSHLIEKYNILNNKLKEREQVLVNCSSSKMLLQINFLKLAEDFKAVQQLLESEVKNISKLITDKSKILSKTEVYLSNSSKESCETIDFKDVSLKTLNNSQNELSNSGIKSEKTYFSSFHLPEDKMCQFSELLKNVENQVDWTESKASLQQTYYQLNDNIIILRVRVRELQEQQKISLETQTKLEKHLKDLEAKLTNVQSDREFEVKKLKQELQEKKNEIQLLEEELQEKKNEIKKLENFVLELKKSEGEGDLFDKEVLGQERNISHKEKTQNIMLESADSKDIQTVVPKSVPAELNEKTTAPSERPEFSDSLEEVPVVNKTFDIVNLEEKNIIDRTFSIKREDIETSSKKYTNGSAWVVSPPSKVPPKVPSNEIVKHSVVKKVQNECWTVPLGTSREQLNKAKKVSSSVNDLRVKSEDIKVSELRKEIAEFSKECDRLKRALLESEQKRKKDKEIYESNQEVIRQNITAKYENQLEHLKNEMKQLYNRELAKHKQEQSNLNSELREQNKRYKEHIDELRNQLWDLGEKLLQEQTLKRDLERNFRELKEKFENILFSKENKALSVHESDSFRQKEPSTDGSTRGSFRQIPSATFPTIPTEDEDEVFDNRFLEDMKAGVCKTERPEDRLKELQYRNSLCLPHLKSSYPGETQFHNPTLFRESELKFGTLPFVQESQSLTDSDHSMTRSLLPDSKGKKKEQTSYKRPGPPTPSKNGGRVSIQSGDLRLTPRNVLKELNDQNERNKTTPNRLKLLLSTKNIRRTSMGGKDENLAPVTPRKKKFFRKPFGARD